MGANTFFPNNSRCDCGSRLSPRHFSIPNQRGLTLASGKPAGRLKYYRTSHDIGSVDPFLDSADLWADQLSCGPQINFRRSGV